jgi:hypothetical protein
MQSISGWDDYKISFVMSVCVSVCLFVKLLCPQISSNFDQTWYGGSEPEGTGRVRVWYKSDINFRFYAAILDFGLLQHLKVGIFEIAITFKTFDQSFRNLVTNFGPTRAITQNVQIYRNPRWRP